MSDIFKHKQPGESTGFLLWKANNLWQREIRKVLKKFELTHTQFVVLATTVWLSMSKSDITQVEIANQIQMDKMLTSNVLRALEKKSLLKRLEHITDTRAKTIQPTEEGVVILRKAVKEVEKFDDHFFGQINKIDAFNSSLHQLFLK